MKDPGKKTRKPKLKKIIIFTVIAALIGGGLYYYFIYRNKNKEDTSKCERMATIAMAAEAIVSNSSKSLQFSGFFRFVTDVNGVIGSLTEEESWSLFNQTIELIREKGAVGIPENINAKTFNDKFPGSRSIVKTNKDKSRKGFQESVFRTKRMEAYLSAVIGSENIPKFTEHLFDQKCFKYNRIRNNGIC